MGEWTSPCELVKIAADRCAAELGVEVGARFHVGDTPNDVIAAEYAGAAALGVTTVRVVHAENSFLAHCFERRDWLQIVSN